MKVNLSLAAVGFAFTTVSSAALAAPILPDASGFGALPVATFGGSGIPNNAVAQTTFNGVTLGLTATPRFSSPSVTNDGAGTFTAHLGEDTVNPTASSPLALWNFNYYIGQQTSTNPLNYFNYRLFYDFSPTLANDQTTHGFINIPGVLSATQAVQGSENLGANFLAVTNALIGLTAPPGATLTSFNPSAPGEYSFKLAAYRPTINGLSVNLYGQEVFNTSMVVGVVPAPAEWAAFLLGLAAMGVVARRKPLR